MRVVVTGSNGRLGQVLVPRLLANPAVDEVIGIDRRPDPRTWPGYRPLQLDVRSAEVARACRGVDAVVHMAFVLMGGGLGRRRHDRQVVRAVNVEGSRRVLAAAARAGVPHLIFLSSVACYGAWPDNPPAIEEGWPLRPNPGFAYGQDKVAVEHWLDRLGEERPHVAITRLRPHVILGPHAHPLLRALLRQPFYPALRQPPKVQAVWEDDVAAAVEQALLEQARGVFNLAAGPAMSLREMLGLVRRSRFPVPIGLLEALHRLAWRVTPAAGEPGWMEGLRAPLVVDTTAARQRLGWQPSLDLPTCVRRIAGLPL